METKVLVTGISGFVGSHVAKLLLDRGYKVRGTVRSLKQVQKLSPLAALPHQERLELVQADLLQAKTWGVAVQGCTHVMHVASPFPSVEPRNALEIIQPAVNGTLAVLNACTQHHVQAVVLTSSIVAVQSLGASAKPEYTEEDWADVKTVPAYNQSKTLAEKAAWDYYHKLEPAQRFRLTTILPGLVFGPSLVATDFTSGEIIRQLMTGSLLALPRVQFGVVDVRNVAEAHVAALENPSSDGHRFLCCSEDQLWFGDIARILRAEFSSRGYPIPSCHAPRVLAQLFSLFNPKVRSVLPFWGVSQRFRNDKIKAQLGIRFISGKEAVIQMAYSLIQHGLVPSRKAIPKL